MARNDRTYVIRVTKSASGSYHAELLEGGAPKTGDLDFNKTTDGMKKTAHYKLDFKIDDSALPQGEKVTFVTDDNDVMWVWTDTSQCPSTKQQMQDTFWVDKNNNGKDLRLINMDLKAQKLRFQINMVTNGTPPVAVPLDPIINNGNNGAPEGFVDSLIAPLVTGLIVGLGTVTLMSGQLVPDAAALLYGIGGALVGLVVGLLFRRM